MLDNSEIEIKFKLKDVQDILAQLGQIAYVSSAPIIHKIQEISKVQLDAEEKRREQESKDK